MKYLVLEDESVITFADSVEFSVIRSQQNMSAVSYGRLQEIGNELYISPASPSRFQKDAEALHLRFPLHRYKKAHYYSVKQDD